MGRQGLITFFSLFFLIFCVVRRGECLYEDQVGKFDWSIQHIGKAKFVHYVHNGQYAKRIVVGTEQNVLAVLNGKNGALGWRHVFEKPSSGQIDDMVVSGQNVIVVNSGGLKVRCFNLASGTLKWETSISSEDIDHKASMQLLNNDPGTVVVSTASRIYWLAVDSGLEKWNVRLSNSDQSVYSQLSQVDGNVVDVKIGDASALSVSGFHKETHNNQPTWTLLFQRELSQHWISTDKKKCGVSSGGKYFVCLDEKNWKLHALSLSRDEQLTSVRLDDIATDFINPSFIKLEDIGILGIDVVALKLRPDHVVVFSTDRGQLKLIHDLKGVTAVQTTIFSGEVYIGMLSRTSSEVLEFSAHSLMSDDRIRHSLKFPSHHGRPFEFYGTSLKGSLSLLVISEDESIVSIQNSGKFMWTREESLSNILSTEMVDLPVSKIMAKMEDEFGVEENILQMFVKRFTTQFSQLKTFLYQLKQQFLPSHHHHHHHRHQQNQGSEEDEDVEQVGNGKSDGEDALDETYLTRDEFNLHKMVVAVTASGKIFGIDSATGKNIWKIFVPDLEPFKVMERKLVMPLFVQRSTSHFPHQPVCTMLGRSKTTGKTLLFSFHPISGTPIPDNEEGGELLSFKVINTMMLHQFDDHFLYPIILLDDRLKIHVVPESAKDLVAKLSPSLFMFSVDSERGFVTGFNIVSKEYNLEAEQLWSLDLGRNSQSITGVYSKPANEHVHSVGLALEDRSVLYKYLNPNLVVVITEGEDASQKEGLVKGMFNVYLIDSVSGSVIFHCNHKRSKGPVNVIHSENWVVYNYWNQKLRRNELAVLEMFEGKVQTNATAFSSLIAPPQPMVMKQAYIFPGHLAALGVTLTEKGLTNKELLFALESGTILGLPKVFIDPRRPEVMSHESREEGLIPYVPELPRPSERIINYYQTVHNIKQIRASPAGLESTSLVFCFGLDMFFTRVTPSKMFDVLKEDFDYFFISSVLIGMIVVSLVSQKLASRKILNRAWK